MFLMDGPVESNENNPTGLDNKAYSHDELRSNRNLQENTGL